jgi:hypothetical protein
MLAACTDSSAPAGPDGTPIDLYQAGRGWSRRIVGLQISPDSAHVVPGQTVGFKASAVLSDGSLRPITVAWAASGGKIDSAGFFVADSTPGAYHVIGTEPAIGLTDTSAVIDSLPPPGTTPITAPAPTDSAPSPSPSVASVSVTPSSATLAVGGSVQLAVTARDLNGNVISQLAVSWSSTNTSVAGVSSSGLVQAVGAGNASIVATVEGVQGKSNITVQSPTTVAGTGDCGSYSHDRLVSVSTESQLSSAIAGAQPGDLIQLASGTYNGRWTITRSGTPSGRIVLCGPRSAVLNGGDLTAGITLNLSGASYWTLSGFTATNSLKGVVVWNGRANILDSLEVMQIGQEGVAVGRFSRSNIVRNNSVHDTGKQVHQYGEGIYIGTSESNWCNFTNCQPDTSDSNFVYANKVYATGADLIQVMAGTTGVIVRKNHLDGGGIVADASDPVWVLAMGNEMIVDSNTAVNALNNGMKTHRNQSGWGNNITFAANIMSVGTNGYGIFLETPTGGDVVRCSNVRTDAGNLSNVACTP